MKTIILLSLLALFSFASCSKCEYNTKENQDYLYGKCWKPASKIIDNTNDGIDNGTEQIASCDLDNCETFNSNGTGYISFGSRLCNGEQSTATTWSWADASQTKLNYKQGNSAPYQFTIIELTDTTFKYFYVLDFTSSGGTYTKITITAVR